MTLGTWLVATAGQAVLRSADNGATWHRLGLRQALEFDAVVRSLCAHPQQPATVYAGTDIGLCVSHDTGGTWQQVNSPFNGQTVWKVAVDPRNPQRLFVGTGAPSRAVLWRSLDGGASWSRANVDIPELCAGVNRPRLLAFAFDPTDAARLWFGLEEGGLFHSTDGGEQWTRVDERLLWNYHTDIHAIHVLPNHGRKTVVVVCVNAVYCSTDDGLTWTGMLPSESHGLYYARAIAAPRDSEDTLYLSLSDGTPGTTSQVLVTRDAGKRWQPLPLPQQPNSCIWALNVCADDPSRVIAGTKYGHLFTSTNAGLSWQKQWRDFSEITDVLWTASVAQITPAHQSITTSRQGPAA